MIRFLDSFFGLTASQTTVRREVVAGLTTFLTMAYILFVNPLILSKAGIAPGAVFVSTVISAGLTTLLMGLWARWPVALAPGMGTNAWFAFGIVGGMGVAFPQALGAVFVSGLVMILFSVLPIRKTMFESIPKNICWGVAVGIGLFITLIGLEDSKIVVDNPATLVSLGHLSDLSPLMTFVGLVLIFTLRHWKVPGALVICILLLTGFNVLLGGAVPDMSFKALDTSSIGALSFSSVAPTVFIGLVVALFLNDFMDSSGTLLGVMTKVSETVEPTRLKKALVVDGIGTVVGAFVGTSTVTSYIESYAGVEAGGRTGLVAIVVGLLFLVSLIAAPLLGLIPAWASAPVLIYVGMSMVSGVKNIDFEEKDTVLPAFLAMVVMPFSYSVFHGMGVAMTTFFCLRVVAGRLRDKQTVAGALITAGYLVFLFQTGVIG